MLRVLIYTLLILNITWFSACAQVLDLSAAKNNPSLKHPPAEVYKPAKLIIGDKTAFIVKGKPGTFVVLAFSAEDKGSAPYYGQQLRLGVIADKVEGVIGENGIARLELELPENKDLIGTILYFEALVWKSEDLSDISRAKIVGINGQESFYNGILIDKKRIHGSLPSIGPGVGSVGDLSRTMRAISGREADDKEYLYTDDIYYKSKPLMLRNLRSPELNQEQEKNKPDEQ